MKKNLNVFISLLVCLAVFMTAGIIAVASPSQVTDISPTRLGESDTFYSFDAETKTLKISGSGSTPDFTNSDGAADSQPWFKWRSDGSVEHIVIEEGVTRLGNYIFTSVSELSVSMPSSLREIGGNAFFGNSKLSAIDLKNVSVISNNAFYRCIGLTSVNIPETAEKIGASAFERCSALESVTFESPVGNVSIAAKAFLSCPNMKAMTLPVGANLGDFSVGFDKALAGEYYDDFIMYVYRDSNAYDYAFKNGLNFELLDVMKLRSGDTVKRTYTNDTLDSEMIFSFTPEQNGRYCFKSSGETDVDCVLSEKADCDIILAESIDNSKFDLNFTITYNLNAGVEYYFRVRSNHSTGGFTVSLNGSAAYGDFNYDGYINAKDYALFKMNCGEYSLDNAELSYYDYDLNGVIDDADWEQAKKNISYVKIDESAVK